jgi:conjugative relaxase-like TrwC/TraI family protein
MPTVVLMLSTASMRGGSFRYYQNTVTQGRCEYYLGVGEEPGRWHGRGIELLDLVAGGVVTEQQVEALFGRALHPENGDALGRGWRIDGVIGFDLCFSAPKSVSALWALGDTTTSNAIRAGHGAAVNAALDYLDAHAAFSRVGRNGVTQVSTDGFAAAVFDHRTSRAGDPQLHSHALVVNKVRCADGKWRAIDGAEIFGHKKSAGTVYQAALRSELTRRLGVAWTPVSEHGQAEIAGVSTALIMAWSTRSSQVAAEAEPVIAAYEASLGRPLTSAERTAVTKVAVVKTRPGKEPVDVVTLRDRWTSEAAELGWDGPSLRRAVQQEARSRLPLDREAVKAGIDQTLADAVIAAGARRAVFTRSDLAAEVAARLPVDGFSADMVRELVEHLTDRALDQAVRLRDHDEGPRRTSDARYASPQTLDQELRIVGRAIAGQRVGFAVADDELVRAACRARGLDGMQTAAIRIVTTRGDFLSVLVAPAGSGKTTAVGAAATAWHQAGYRVLGLAPSARAAKELADATGNPADTIAKFLHAQPRLTTDNTGQLQRYRLRDRTVVVIDEASMLATADLDQLTALAAQAGAKVVLVGDPAQLGTIDRAGGMLLALADALHAPSLEQVHRFDQAWERAASLLLRAGNPAALRGYLDHDRVHPAATGDQAIDNAMKQWTAADNDGKRVMLMARSRRDVDTLNTHARVHLIDRGVVHGPVLLDGPIEWRAGDQLRATRNNRGISVGDGYLRNGDHFTVLARSRDGLLVEHASGTRLTLPAGYVREHATYGWASTVDSAQGATVDIGILLARPGIDREHLYVGLTRGRQANDIHLAPGEISDDHHLQAPTSADSLDAAERALTDALGRTGKQAAAHTRLQQPAPQRSHEPVLPAGRALDEALHRERYRAEQRGLDYDFGR